MASAQTISELSNVDHENTAEHIKRTEEEDDLVHLALVDITDVIDPPHPRGIPAVKFLEDIHEYVESFAPKRVTAELLIGAYTQLHTKYKLSESSLLRKRRCLLRFIPRDAPMKIVDLRRGGFLIDFSLLLCRRAPQAEGTRTGKVALLGSIHDGETGFGHHQWNCTVQLCGFRLC
jgi:hypothetical protein